MTDAQITFFDQYSFIGGGQIVLLALVKSAIRIGRHPVVVVPMGGVLEKELRQRFRHVVEAVPAEEANLTHGRKTPLDVFRLAKFTFGFVFRHRLLVRKSTLLYGNGPRQFLGLMILSVVCKRNCCYHVHVNHSWIEKKLLALAASLPTTYRIVINSEFIKRQLVSTSPTLAKSSKIVVIENGLDSRYEDRTFVNRFENHLVQWNVAVFGVLRPEKGQDIAIELARRNKSIHLHLLGRTGEGAEGWVAALHKIAPNNVTFHGAVLDVPSMLDRLNVHISLVPSRWDEPFGLAAIEGMACSCITLVSRSGALVDIAIKTGAIIYGIDVDDLESAIVRLREMDSLKLAQIAHGQFTSTFQAYRAKHFADRIDQLLASSPTP